MVAPSVEVPNLRRVVTDLVRQVPAGRVATFRGIAQALGDAMASRAVGQIVAEAQGDASIPTHRVIRSDGRVGSNDSTTVRQLGAEGVPLQVGRVDGACQYLFADFATDYPLRRLQAMQDELAAHVDGAWGDDPVETIAGVDLSYRGPWCGIGAYVLMDAHETHVQATRTVEQETDFPYIPTYLAFRELPVLLALLEAVRETDQMADVLLVDGTGLLHHRHAGIAAHLGVLTDVPTVGVTKSLLYGDVQIDGMQAGDVRWVADPERPDERLGAAVKTTDRANPIYVSIGHRVDLDTAVDLVLQTSSRKLPEPIRRADQLSRQATRRPKADSQGSGAFGL